jgi:hypothetical protein
MDYWLQAVQYEPAGALGLLPALIACTEPRPLPNLTNGYAHNRVFVAHEVFHALENTE